MRWEMLRICQKALDDGRASESEQYSLFAAMWEAPAGLEDEAEAARWEVEARAVCSKAWMLESARSHLERLKALLLDSPLKHLKP